MDILKKLAKLIDVKSLVTLGLVGTLIIVVLAKLQIEENIFQLFSYLLMLICGFYFGKKESGPDEQK